MKVTITLKDKKSADGREGTDIELSFDPPITVGEAAVGVHTDSPSFRLATQFLQWMPTLGKCEESRLVSPDGEKIADIDLHKAAENAAKAKAEHERGGLEQN